MKNETKTVMFCAANMVILLIYINLIFYSVFELPFGMIDVDGYLFHHGDLDPRIQDINEGMRIKITWQYMVFYGLLDILGNPRITFLWLPPVLLGLLIMQVYWIYEHTGTNALTQTIMFVTMTYAVPFFYTAALYRQLLGMVFFLAGYNLILRGRRTGYLLAAFGFLTHIHLAPIAGLYILADRIHKRQWGQTAALLTIFGVIALKTKIILAIGPLQLSPQPTLYTQLFTLTNPILLIYALKKPMKSKLGGQPQWDIKHILLILLILTMPFTDQSRGLIFLHILLAQIAHEKYTREQTPQYYHLALIILSFLWYMNLMNFMIHSFIADGAERNLDLMPVLTYLQTHIL